MPQKCECRGPMKTFLLLAALLTTAVNLPAERGDVIPARYTVHREAEYVTIWIEWKLEPFGQYDLQESSDLKNWTSVNGEFLFFDYGGDGKFSGQWDAVGFGGPVKFIRMVDADSF